MRVPCIALLLSVVAPGGLRASAQSADEPQAVERAIRFLAREVPRWPAENRCFSCHNNGDAARALYAALGRGMAVPAESLRETNAWLAMPEAWDDNNGEGAFNDDTLSNVQFANALRSAIEVGAVSDRSSLTRAARRVAEAQRADGSWQLDASASIGSPATYGTALATWAARRAMDAAGSEEFEATIRRADDWLRRVEVRTVLDASAVLLGLGSSVDEAAIRQRRHCLEILQSGRAPSGGWGAYLSSVEEPFDTAVVLLALQSSRSVAAPVFDRAALDEAIESGRQFLLDRQLDDGSWVETTRPAGQQSYAQYISTTGWATLALLETSPQ